MSPRRKQVTVAAGGALVLFSIWGLGALRATPPAWNRVERGKLVVTVDVEGTLGAVRSDRLGPPPVRMLWEYKIAQMAPDGSDVREGDVALVFDSSELERQLLEVRAMLESAEKEIEKKRTDILVRRRDGEVRLAEAEAKRDKAELKLERPEEFVAAKEIATLELDRKLARDEVTYLKNREELLRESDAIELGILEGQRDQARLRVREIEEAIDRMTLRAPRDGTVIHLPGRNGEKKRVGDAVWRRDRILEIPDLSVMKARGIVDEADAGRLTLDQPVELRLDAYPDVTFTGHIARIGKAVQPKTRNSPLRVVPIEIALDETDPNRMRPEMRFRGTIEVERRETVLIVPASAVHTRVSGAVVYRRSLSGEQETPVTLGLRNRREVEITSGLSEQDEVRVRQ